jgi:hypothetical protein
MRLTRTATRLEAMTGTDNRPSGQPAAATIAVLGGGYAGLFRRAPLGSVMNNERHRRTYVRH